ncbi:hypothetical protein ABIE91_001156 [Bradyrhizobium elkanii]|uniref:Uncharacterized protein n=1 Tax=Bradyrhizobium brasilense TaxID=1419277 RepID=A0A1G7PD87_9BRAD|nr:hypothetical protein SAMN05216337_10787 [Bradyrhizobium brasilense]
MDAVEFSLIGMAGVSFIAFVIVASSLLMG